MGYITGIARLSNRIQDCGIIEFLGLVQIVPSRVAGGENRTKRAGPRNPKVPESHTPCKRTHESKAQTQYADHARAMARTFNKISVPQERGRFAQPALLPARPYYPCTLLV